MDAIHEVEQMPSLRHNYLRPDGEEFDYRKSEATAWMMGQPACYEVMEQMVFDMVRRERAIVWLDAGVWRGNKKLREENIDPMHSLKLRAVLAARAMPDLETDVVGAWLMEQNDCFQFAANQFWQWLRGKPAVMRCRRPEEDPEGIRLWSGCGAGAYDDRRRSIRKRIAAGVRDYHARMRVEREQKRLQDLPELMRRKEEEKERRKAERKKKPGFRRHANDEAIMAGMCSFPPDTKRGVIFAGLMARFPVSSATLDRYRRFLLSEGRLLHCGAGGYSPGPGAAPAPMDEPVFL